MSNPIFSRVKRETRGNYTGFDDAPIQDIWVHQDKGHVSTRPTTGLRVTLDDVLMKTLLLFAIVLGVGAVSWVISAASSATGSLLWMGGMVGTLVLGLVIAFMRSVNVPLILAYAVLEGVFVGAVSQYFSDAYEGSVPTALVATLCVFGAMFGGWRSGLVRVTSKFRRMMGLALVGYAIFALVNLVAALLGVGAGWGFGGTGPLGILISLFATGLAAFTLALDFDAIDEAVRVGMPEKYSWLLAHGLVVTVVWLYIELLRLIGRFRD